MGLCLDARANFTENPVALIESTLDDLLFLFPGFVQDLAFPVFEGDALTLKVVCLIFNDIPLIADLFPEFLALAVFLFRRGKKLFKTNSFL